MSAHEQKIKERMAKLDITADFLAALSEVAPTRFSLAFRGTKDFDNEQVNLIYKWLDRLDELVEVCSPIPVALSNARIVRGVLESRASGDLWIDVRVSQADWEKQKTQDNSSVAAQCIQPIGLGPIPRTRAIQIRERS